MTHNARSTVRSSWTRLASVAPLVSLSFLLVFPWAVAQDPLDQELLHARHDRVRVAIESLPEKLGSWVFVKEAPIPTGALKILNPNAYVSRTYQRIGVGQSVFATVMVIHCSDVRDMSMHFPPVCYPRSGWTQLGEFTRDWVVDVGGNRRIMGRTYSFQRMEKNRLDRVITVADTFLLPGGMSTRHMSDLLHVASQHQRSVEGVAQVQVYFEADSRSPELMQQVDIMVGEIIEGLPAELFEVLDGSSGRKSDPKEQGTS
jgi:hypothetical protein